MNSKCFFSGILLLLTASVLYADEPWYQGTWMVDSFRAPHDKSNDAEVLFEKMKCMVYAFTHDRVVIMKLKKNVELNSITVTIPSSECVFRYEYKVKQVESREDRVAFRTEDLNPVTFVMYNSEHGTQIVMTERGDFKSLIWKKRRVKTAAVALK